jgi:methionine-rich copper-binding protein CopC
MTLKLATRIALLLSGFALLLFGTWSWLIPRARYLSSNPRASEVVATGPTVVAIDFSEALDRESTISVASTITVGPNGERIYGDGKRFTAKGPSQEGANPRSLTVGLDRGLPNGLYWVQWTAISARWRSQRSGRFCFGVGMSIPDDVIRDMPGAIYERDYRYREHRAMLLGGVLLVGLGLFLPPLRVSK